MAALRALVLTAACLVGSASGGGLVGPGAVGSYQGAGNARRYGGSVRVSEPSVGFFVAGSSIRELNGLYGRVNPEDASAKLKAHHIHWLYKHDYTGWSLAYVKATAAVESASGKSTEWLLIDNDGVDRLRHDGGTYLPGSGTSWSHVHRTENAEPNPKAGSAVASADKDDEEEYPWQVIGVSAASMMENLRAHFRHYKHTVQHALAGTNLPKVPFVSPRVYYEGGSSKEDPPEDLEVSALLEDDAGNELCLPEHADELAEELERVKGNKWAQAVLQLRTVSCYRWRQEMDNAQSLLDKVTDLFPRYKAALFERALLLMDKAQYKLAVTAFELLLRIDRAYPDLDAWLVRANAHVKREEMANEENGLSGFEKDETEHCVAWRQTGGCKPTGPREPGSDRSCNDEVPQGSSGYCECKSEGVAEPRAMAVICVHPPFRCSFECKSEFGNTKGWMPFEVDPAPDSCKLRKDGSSPAWCSPNHYVVLGVPCDLPWPEAGVENELMKRAYKRRSLQVHPDKSGGSVRAFQRVAAAHEVLTDPEKRAHFDEGYAFERTVNKDNTLGPTYSDEIVKKYFPDRFDCEPFGDPHNDRRERAARKARLDEKRRQDKLLTDVKREEQAAQRLAASEASRLKAQAAREEQAAARLASANAQAEASEATKLKAQAAKEAVEAARKAADEQKEAARQAAAERRTAMDEKLSAGAAKLEALMAKQQERVAAGAAKPEALDEKIAAGAHKDPEEGERKEL